MFDPKKFKVSEPSPNLCGGIGQGGPMDDFHSTWRMKKVVKGCWVVGKRVEDGYGCFSLQRFDNGLWDIAFYAECTAAEIFESIKHGGSLHAGNAEYHTSDPRNKYLAIDLMRIMREWDKVIAS